MKTIFYFMSVMFAVILTISCDTQNVILSQDDGFAVIEKQENTDIEIVVSQMTDVRVELTAVDVPVFVDDEIVVDTSIDIPEHETVDVFISVTGKMLSVDIYEVSIDKYATVFPEYYAILIERIKNVSEMPLWVDDGLGMGDYPALVDYDEAVRYADAVDMRLPLVEEWLDFAEGNGKLGISNVTPVFEWGFNRARFRPEAVNNHDAIPNGYGMYEVLGNAYEWCGNIYENKVGLRAVMAVSWNTIGQIQDINKVRPAFIWTQDERFVYSEGFRLVKDIN